jgi:mannobiose 2-epimerase
MNSAGNPAAYSRQMQRQLRSILNYWIEYAPDHEHGGFIGRVDEKDRPDPNAPKGLVLNSRILWTFSSAYRHTRNAGYLMVARRAFEYLLNHFPDDEHGGVFWSLDAAGHPLNDRKQIYGHAFFLYGLTEFYRAASSPGTAPSPRTEPPLLSSTVPSNGLSPEATRALTAAIALFRLIEQHSFDTRRKGYYEAFARDWQPLQDLRLSEKDDNGQKTMNTHLHVLEAYSNLYKCWPDSLLRRQIIGLLEVFDSYMIDHRSGHLLLFFNEDWQSRSTLISYGHDIEAAWLLQEAAETIGDEKWIARTRTLALRIATAAVEGLDNDDGLWYERENDTLVLEKHWWPQAEAMVGFLHVWQISGDETWYRRSLDSWNFVKRYLLAPMGKEWYWGVLADHSPMPGQDKAGFWKCPYHNSRACLEILRRLHNFT